MNRSYIAQSPYSLTPTERINSQQGYGDGYGGYGAGHGGGYGEGYSDAYAGVAVDEYEYEGLQEFTEEDLEALNEARIDRRWMWIAGIAGVILFIAVATTGVILGGGDSGSVSATSTSAAPASSAAPATTSALPPAAATPAPVAPSLPAETVTTVSPTASPEPAATPEASTEATAEAVPPPSPRTVTYRVTGDRQLIDMVTIIYTDNQGALQTDVNVALPWTKTVTLDPGVELKSVTATSVAGQLNCSITDAAGNVLVAQNNNAMIATCTQ